MCVADCLCRLWDLNEGLVRSEFKLESPGVSVRWHPQDPMKVGGRKGGRKWERGKRRDPREGMVREGRGKGVSLKLFSPTCIHTYIAAGS